MLLPTDKFLPARTGSNYQQILINSNKIKTLIPQILESKYLVIDFETTGLDYTDKEKYCIGVGLAWNTGSCYIPLSKPEESLESDEFGWYIFSEILAKHPRLIAHNSYFDGGWILRVTGKHPNWYMDTYSAIAHLANEGYADRPAGWGLKSCMTEFLNWKDSNESELDEWLVSNKYYIGVTRKDESETNLVDKLRQKKLRPDKSQMWRAPVGILGKYCCLDVEATYQLFTGIILPALEDFPQLHDFLTIDFQTHINLHIEQKFHGIKMDRPKLQTVIEATTKRMQELSNQFYQLPELQEAIKAVEEISIEKHSKLEPKKYLDIKKRQEPDKLTVSGQVSKNWLKWEELDKQSKLQEPCKSWINWKNRQENLRNIHKFNLQSGTQLRQLFYEELHYPILIETEKFLPSVAVKAIRGFGNAGKILAEYTGLSKELGYLEAYLELSKRDGRLRPNFRLPGAKTGRLTSSDPNFMQVPKTKEILSCFLADDGYEFVDLDYSALESVVAAELSQDPNLKFLYQNGGTSNDVHLFIGSQIPGPIGERIRQSGYDPYNATSASVSKAKKECKKERSICKTTVYACVAQDTLVLTKSGYKKIQLITNQDKVWDGIEWVSTDGAVSKGVKECILLDGSLLTKDHKVLGKDGKWREASEYSFQTGTNSPQPVRPRLPSATWSDIWKLVCSRFKS